MLRNVTLHGPLGSFFDQKTYRFQADDIHQLFSGLSSIFPNFRSELRKHEDLCLLKVNGERTQFVSENELQFKFGDYPDLHLSTGSRGNAAAGAAAFVSAVGATGVAATVISAVVYVAISVAISYAVSAVMASLADTPNVQEAQGQRDDKSSLFNGPSNREAQGGRTQLVYGRFLVGSYTLSQTLEAKRQPIGLSNTLSLVEGTSASVNVFLNDAALVNPEVTTFNVGGTGALNAGQTFTGTGYTVTVNSAGLLTVNTTLGTYGYTVLITVSAESEGGTGTIPFLQNVTVTVTQDYGYYSSQLQGDSGNGGAGGEAGGGGGI